MDLISQNSRPYTSIHYLINTSLTLVATHSVEGLYSRKASVECAVFNLVLLPCNSSKALHFFPIIQDLCILQMFSNVTKVGLKVFGDTKEVKCCPLTVTKTTKPDNSKLKELKNIQL